MGEIKSTLDLVMERTRHLSLSAEEKARQQIADFEKRLQGLLQQYADNAVSVDTLRDRIAELQAELNITDRQLLVNAVFNRIDPDQDNERWLHLLASFMPAARDPLQKTLAAYREQQADLLQTSKQRLLDQLVRRHGVWGSAVVPNPQKDPEYQQSLAALRRDTQARIGAISLDARVFEKEITAHVMALFLPQQAQLFVISGFQRQTCSIFGNIYRKRAFLFTP